MREIELLRGFWTHQCGIVPGELRHRLWQFLEPTVIREASVINGGIWPEKEFELAGGALFGRRKTRGIKLQRNIGGSKRSACHHAVV